MTSHSINVQLWAPVCLRIIIIIIVMTFITLWLWLCCSVSDDVKANSDDARSRRWVDTRHSRLFHSYVSCAVCNDNCAVVERVDTSCRWLHIVPTPVIRRSVVICCATLQLETYFIRVRQWSRYHHTGRTTARYLLGIYQRLKKLETSLYRAVQNAFDILNRL